MKINKALGLQLKDAQGKRIAVDDPRLDPLWAKAGELGIPVEIHIGDPAAFFTTFDRFDELQFRPRWLFYPGYPSLEEIVKPGERVVSPAIQRRRSSARTGRRGRRGAPGQRSLAW